MANKLPQFNKSSVKAGGIGRKYPAVDGYSGGNMQAPGEGKSDALQAMKKSAGGSASQKIPGASKTSREEKK